MAAASASDGVPSYRADDEKFVKGRVAVFKTGVVMKDAPKAFTVDPSTLELHDIVGRGASSVVRRAIHKPTGTPLALKVFNINDKDKRSQLISEIETLYNADCERCVCPQFRISPLRAARARPRCQGARRCTVYNTLRTFCPSVLSAQSGEVLRRVLQLGQNNRRRPGVHERRQPVAGGPQDGSLAGARARRGRVPDHLEPGVPEAREAFA